MRGKKKNVFLPRISLLPCCVMVAPQILVLFVWVRILSGQQKKPNSIVGFGFFLHLCRGFWLLAVSYWLLAKSQ